MNPEGMDTDSIRLLIEMYKEDIENLTAKSKGKQPQGVKTDSDYAIEACKVQLQSLETYLSDRGMCKSIAGEADVQDSQYPASDASHSVPPSESDIGEDGLDDEMLNAMTALYDGSTDEDVDDHVDDYVDDHVDGQVDGQAESSAWAESSSWAASRPGSHPFDPNTVCVGCGEECKFYDVAQCPCQHEYCRDCLGGLFQASMTNEALFPPRCCGKPVPFDKNRLFLTSKLAEEFEAKKVELETQNRTYCHDPTCSTFVPGDSIKDDVAHCPRCSKATCAICKSASHEGDCPTDSAMQDLLQMAAENDWQSCYSCNRLVELQYGCNHMTCICGAQFCYVCGLAWKICDCAPWDENRLIASIEAIADRQAEEQVVNVQQWEREIEQERQEFRENDDCYPHAWTWRTGSYRCEDCFEMFTLFIFECQRCHLLACRRCVLNHL
ncbi:hypothetical protein CDD81_1467 [Ophiocordyceps australis]|uniref:RBR-type E3 ubiquitin transferase n=1 Tax=Ophiocordyceps australis TaxID=1399860 RepID=A0A2C5YE36_9HYPO|nr:hypothetical protein CDD81_1467 [Ophiocordyceps australis]